jgi:hypothetical protein
MDIINESSHPFLWSKVKKTRKNVFLTTLGVENTSETRVFHGPRFSADRQYNDFLSCAHALYEMDRAGRGRFTDRILLYSLGGNRVPQYHCQRCGCHRHQLRQTRLLPFCIGRGLPLMHLYATSLGQATQPVGDGPEYGLGNEEFFCAGHLFRGRMS